MGDKAPKKMNLAVRPELMAWVTYASGLHDQSATEYINSAIRRDMENATPEVMEGYEAFVKAREAAGL